MRISKYLMAVALCLLAMPAWAQPPEDEGSDRPPADRAVKQKLLDNFDTNKDGTIDRTEAREIGRALRENFNVGPPGRGQGRPGGPDGRRAESRGPDGPPRDGRGPDGERGRSRAGRPPGPNPERIFAVFDENDDGSLSKEEFLKLHEFAQSMRQHMGPPPWARQAGGRGWEGDGDRPPGPPRDFERGRGRGGRGWGDGPPRPPRPDGPPPEDGAGFGPPPGDGPPPEAGADAAPADDVDASI